MKKLFILFILSAATILISFSQIKTGKFGLEVNQFVVASGFGTGTEVQVNISDNIKRRLSIGIFYDTKLNNIGGFSISTQRMLGKYTMKSLPAFEPYIFYNLIYHKTRIDQSQVSDNYFVAAGNYKSIEHHTGFGMRVNIIPGIYIKGETGYGLYIGSIMKPSKPDPILNESFGTTGSGILVKIGIGIFI